MKINGIKLGFENKRIQQNHTPRINLPPIYALLSDTNISFLNIDETLDETYISCCLKDGFDALSNTIAEKNKTVCTVSIFPHQGNIDILKTLLGFLAGSHYPVYDFATSNAMLTFVTDYHFGGAICEDLSNHFKLPASHSPFFAAPPAMDDTLFKTGWPEVCASYVEKKIKTYGFNIKTGMALYTVQADFKNNIIWDQTSQEHHQANGFYFASGHIMQNEQIRLFCVSDPDQNPAPWDLFSHQKSHVDLLSFQGPHFGDRYGIANNTMSLLAAENIQVLVAGFTGACVYMVLPDNTAERAVDALLKGFTTP